jgi:YbbR domain-containing protein
MAIKSQKNQKIMVVVISILLAFFLWLYVMGEKNPVQSKQINDVPVSLTNMELVAKSNLAVSPEQSFAIDINVTGRAFDISKISASDIKIEADLGGSIKKGYNNIPIKITCSQKGINVVSKSGLSYISVKLDVLAEKLVPVIVNVRGNVKDGYGYTKPLVRPSEVKVSGPAEYVDTVFATVGEINISGNYTNISGSISLIPQDKNGTPVSHINISPKYVDATVSIKPSKEVPVKVNTYGAVGTGKILSDISPQVKSVVIIGDSKYLDKINVINTTALDLSKITNSSTIPLALNVPIGVNVVDGVDSINVDITVENKVEKVMSLPIIINNQSTDFDYNMPQQVVTVKITGPSNIINTLSEKNVNAFVEVGGFTEGSYTVPITINQIDGVDVSSLTPDSVTVQIIKK